ncbi:MAG: YdcF family protein [Clostridia bacterium]|nr:YdcF family protein [Clostridia bacterium]
MKFFTKEKKPKLYDVLAAAAAAAAAVAVLHFAGKGELPLISAIVLDVFFLYLTARLVIACEGQIRYNPYSYNTIFYAGFALFSLSVLITHIVLTVRIAAHPDVYGTGMIVSILASSARNYMILSAPFILVISIALCVSNVSLIKHEGFRPVNVLGIVLSALLISGEVFMFTFDHSASGSQSQVMIHDLLVNVFAAVYLYFECMIIGVIFAEVLVCRHEPAYDKDFVIILGCGLRKDGTPTPLLAGRVDRAIAFAEKQEKTSGKRITFITSGGKGDDEHVSESASMKRYMLEHGVPEDRIIEEDQSVDTVQNMRFSNEKIKAAGGGKAVFSTTNYHVFRSGICSARVKMRAEGIGARTKWYFWPNASVREFACLLVAHKRKQAIILAALTAAYVALTLLMYR